MSGPRTLLVAAVLAAAASSCGNSARTRPSTPPASRAPRSTIPEADRLITLLNSDFSARLLPTMSPRLKSRVNVALLEGASARLRRRFGAPVGVMEEHVHQEGPLRWYSGIVIHGRPLQSGGDGSITPVLYQFAIDGDQRIARLLVREHAFVGSLEHPARDYVPITRFHFPSTGTWTVLHGGSRRTTNYHHGSRAQRWAYDLVMKRNGLQKPPRATRNREYYCYGRPVLAPAPGVVVKAIDGVAENVPGKRGRAGGNGVIIDHGFGEFSSLWHGIPGSVRVRVGDRVQLGQELFRVGNSGSSTGPHIHFHVATKEPNAMALPAQFVDLYVNGVWHEQSMPVRGDRIQAAERWRTAKVRTAILDV